MQKFILAGVFFIYRLEALISLQQGIAGKYIDGFGVVDLEFLLDDHYELENSEGLQNQDPR